MMEIGSLEMGVPSFLISASLIKDGTGDKVVILVIFNQHTNNIPVETS